MALLDDLMAIRDGYVAKLAALSVTDGGVDYSLDGESYTVKRAELVKLIADTDDRIKKIQQRVPGRRRQNIVNW